MIIRIIICVADVTYSGFHAGRFVNNNGNSVPPGNLLVSENSAGRRFTLWKFMDGKVDWLVKSGPDVINAGGFVITLPAVQRRNTRLL